MDLRADYYHVMGVRVNKPMAGTDRCRLPVRDGYPTTDSDPLSIKIYGRGKTLLRPPKI